MGAFYQRLKALFSGSRIAALADREPTEHEVAAEAEHARQKAALKAALEGRMGKRIDEATIAVRRALGSVHEE